MRNHSRLVNRGCLTILENLLVLIILLLCLIRLPLILMSLNGLWLRSGHLVSVLELGSSIPGHRLLLLISISVIRVHLPHESLTHQCCLCIWLRLGFITDITDITDTHVYCTLLLRLRLLARFGDDLVDLMFQSHSYQGLSLWLRFIYSGNSRVIFRLSLLVRLGGTLDYLQRQSLPYQSGRL